MRALTACVLTLVWGAATVVNGQPAAVPRIEVSGGYSSIDGARVVADRGSGWVVGFGWNASPRFAVVMEAGSNRLFQDAGLLDVTADFHQLMVGARYTLPVRRLRPYVQALFGGSRIDLAVSAVVPFTTIGIFDETRWAYQMGGGLDVPLSRTDRVALRVGADYRRVRAIAPFGQGRVYTMVVTRFWQR